MLAHVNCSERDDSAIVARNAVRIASASATISVLRKIESRSRLVAGPPLSVIAELVRSVPSGPIRGAAPDALPSHKTPIPESARVLSIAPCPPLAPVSVANEHYWKRRVIEFS